MPKNKNFPVLWVALFLLWLFFSLGSYYLVQKPFTLPQIMYLAQDSFIWQKVVVNAAALQRTLLDLLVGGWMVLLAAGLGGWLLRLSRWSPPSLLAELVLSTGLGWGGLGLLTLLLGAMQLYQPAVFKALAGVMTLVAFEIEQ